MSISEREVDMLFEELAKAVFKCDRGGDPWGYANAEVYDLFVSDPIQLEGKRALSNILIKLILDCKNSTNIEIYKELDDKIWMATSQDEIIEIINETVQVFNKSS